MKIEKANIKARKLRRSNLSKSLMELNPKEAIRIKTAGEYYSMVGRLTPIGKSRNVFFGTRLDGDDVLVFIKGERI